MIWVIGARGMLGTDLFLELQDRGYDVLATDVECDVLNPEALATAAGGQAIDWVVNCCAYTAVDKSEDDRDAAYVLNVDGATNVAEAARSLGARMIHISTDYVFDGTSHRPYRETDPVSPVGVYACSKAEGEKAVLSASEDNYVLRTAWLYGKHGGNFVHTMLRLMQERDSVAVVSDQYGSPTWTWTVCSAIGCIIELGKGPGGIYHVTNRGEVSWFGFARAIQSIALEAGLLSRKSDIVPLTTGEYPTRAIRPAYSVLSCAKIEQLLGVRLPAWSESLSSFIAREMKDLSR
jgi:dTDP-4-dehydrorhamnose reductase